MASRSLRRFSACFASLETKSSLLELGQAVDQPADLLTERLVDVLAGDGRVFNRVVQHRRHDRGVVDLKLGQDGRHFERMGEIGIARGPLLAAMRLHRKHIGAIEEILIGVRIVAADPLHQFVLPHHRVKPTKSAPAPPITSWRRPCVSTRTDRRERMRAGRRLARVRRLPLSRPRRGPSRSSAAEGARKR